MQIIISIFIPFLIPAIKFITSKAPGEDQEREEEEIIEEECMAMSEDPHATTNKVTPENTIDFTEQELKPKKYGKFYKVAMCACGNTEDTISIPYAIYYFYTAPVTKFWIYLVRCTMLFMSLLCKSMLDQIMILFLHLCALWRLSFKKIIKSSIDSLYNL